MKLYEFLREIKNMVSDWLNTRREDCRRGRRRGRMGPCPFGKDQRSYKPRILTEDIKKHSPELYRQIETSLSGLSDSEIRIIMAISFFDTFLSVLRIVEHVYLRLEGPDGERLEINDQEMAEIGFEIRRSISDSHIDGRKVSIALMAEIVIADMTRQMLGGKFAKLAPTKAEMEDAWTEVMQHGEWPRIGGFLQHVAVGSDEMLEILISILSSSYLKKTTHVGSSRAGSGFPLKKKGRAAGKHSSVKYDIFTLLGRDGYILILDVLYKLKSATKNLQKPYRVDSWLEGIKSRGANLDLDEGRWDNWIMQYYVMADNEAKKGNDKRFPGLEYVKTIFGWRPKMPSLQEEEELKRKKEEHKSLMEDKAFEDTKQRFSRLDLGEDEEGTVRKKPPSLKKFINQETEAVLKDIRVKGSIAKKVDPWIDDQIKWRSGDNSPPHIDGILDFIENATLMLAHSEGLAYTPIVYWPGTDSHVPHEPAAKLIDLGFLQRGPRGEFWVWTSLGSAMVRRWFERLSGKPGGYFLRKKENITPRPSPAQKHFIKKKLIPWVAGERFGIVSAIFKKKDTGKRLTRDEKEVLQESLNQSRFSRLDLGEDEDYDDHDARAGRKSLEDKAFEDIKQRFSRLDLENPYRRLRWKSF